MTRTISLLSIDEEKEMITQIFNELETNATCPKKLKNIKNINHNSLIKLSFDIKIKVKNPFACKLKKMLPPFTKFTKFVN